MSEAILRPLGARNPNFNPGAAEEFAVKIGIGGRRAIKPSSRRSKQRTQRQSSGIGSSNTLGTSSAWAFCSLTARGMGAQDPEYVRHAVTSGQDVLRSLILSGEDRRRFFIHPRCPRTVEAFKNYRATELAEGIYDPRPDPDPSNHTYSHGTDQARYLCWSLRTAFGLAGYEE